MNSGIPVGQCDSCGNQLTSRDCVMIYYYQGESKCISSMRFVHQKTCEYKQGHGKAGTVFKGDWVSKTIDALKGTTFWDKEDQKTFNTIMAKAKKDRDLVRR